MAADQQDFDRIADAATEAGAWLHIDGAIGLWAATSPALRHLVNGAERADSWAFDAHKWLNVPYDSGVAFCAHPDAHRAELVERTCAHARRFAEGVARIPGCQILNQVVINQVLFRFQDDRATDRVLRGVVDSGEAWLSGTTVDGRRAIRLSVSNWQTSDRDIDRTLEAFRACGEVATRPDW